jgi:tetratricopeptide (TPR) repeat protein
MNISEFRTKYPQYNDVDDKTLSDKFYNKYYSDVPRVDFDKKFIGETAPTETTPMDQQQNTPTKSKVMAILDKTAEIAPYAQAALSGPAAQGEGDFSPMANTVMTLAGAKPAEVLRNLPQNVKEMSPTARFGPVIGAGVNAARLAGEIIRPGYDVAEKIPDKSLAYLTAGMLSPAGEASKAASLSSKAVNKAIDKGLAKGIRPSHAGVKDISGMRKMFSRGREAVKTIFSNKKSLNIVDEFGEKTGRLPETLEEFSQAIDQTKRKVFEQYDNMAQAAGQKKARIPMYPLAKELDILANDRVMKNLHPEVVKWASDRARALRRIVSLTPEEVQAEIAHVNQITKAFQQNPIPSAIKTTTGEAMYGNILRKALDQRIEKAVGPGYQQLKKQYGALKSIEKDVVKRAIVDARKNSKGLIDFSDIGSAAEFARGLLTLNPGDIASGAVIKGVSKYYKYLNNPNTAIKNMFKAIEKTSGLLDEVGKSIGTGVTQAAAMQAGRTLQPSEETGKKVRQNLTPGSIAGALETTQNQGKTKLTKASDRGIEYYTNNNWSQAIKEWQKALKEEPKKAKEIIGWINTAKKEQQNYKKIMANMPEDR